MTNPNGRFGIHGGQYIPETLMNAVKELEEAYNHYKNDPEFNRELTEQRLCRKTIETVLCRKDDKGSRWSKNIP